MNFKKIMAVALTSIIGAFSQVWDGTSVDIAWYTGNMEKDTFYIANANELAGLSYLANNGFDFGHSVFISEKTIILTDNIDLGNKSWTPIKDFRGSTFDGNGYSISNLSISKAVEISSPTVVNGSFAGLFAMFSAREIKNLVVNISKITVNLPKSDVNIDLYAGGLAGRLSARTVKNCVVNIRDGIYAVSESKHCYVGGLAGYTDGNPGTTIVNSRVTGNISGSYKGTGLSNVSVAVYVGGLVGRLTNSATISSSYVAGDINANCHYDFQAYAGGLIGHCLSINKVSDSYVTGNVTANIPNTGRYANAGGLVGETGEYNFENSYVAANVTVNGNVSGTGNFIFAGGLAGSGSKDGNIVNCYYNSAGASKAIGNIASGTDISAKTSAQLKQSATFIGWDFSSVWNINPTINSGYPYLRYFTEFVAVRNISGIPSSVEYDGTYVKAIELNANVEPNNATNKDIVWNLYSGTATLQGNTLRVISPGVVKVKAVITNGLGGDDYEQIFTIDIGNSTPISEIKKSDNHYGIRFKENVVWEKLEILDVILPKPDKLAEIVKVVIYDNTGNVVYSGKEKKWDLTNKSGRFVADGAYLVIVEAKGRSGKVYWYSAKVGVNR